MDAGIIWTIIGAAIATIATIYTFLRNFKTDINAHIDRLEKRMIEDNAKMDQRVMETNKRMDGVYHVLLKRSGLEKEV
jgi:hypothetical protein